MIYSEAGADPGWVMGVKRPPSRIILGKTKEWCNGIKNPKIPFSLVSFMTLLYLILGCTHQAPYFNFHHLHLEISN